LPITAIAWKESCKGLKNVSHGKKVGIEGQWHMFNGLWQVKCASITNLYRESKEVSQARVRLRVILSWLPNSPLREFILSIFNDKNILEKFIIAPGSISHHHNYRGGLLVHSAETAWQVFNNQQLQPDDRHFGAVIALLHDIGKIWSYSSNKAITELGSYVDHELLTLEVLAPHLNWLDHVDAQLAIAIRYSLVWKKKSYDSIPKMDVIEVLKSADRLSAGSSLI